MLRRILNDNEFEYEIQYTTKEIEQKFYKYFIEYVETRNIDIAEYQIIINPLQFKIEIRIRMNRLGICFAQENSLDNFYKYGERATEVKAAFEYICSMMERQVSNYAINLCYRDKEEKK